jgi:hypothetical protein
VGAIICISQDSDSSLMAFVSFESALIQRDRLVVPNINNNDRSEAMRLTKKLTQKQTQLITIKLPCLLAQIPAIMTEVLADGVSPSEQGFWITPMLITASDMS